MKRIVKALSAFILIAVVFAIHPVSAEAAAPVQDVTQLNAQLLNDINSLRASQGLPGLTLDAGLTAIAATRSQEASTVWSHTRPNGQQGISMLPSDKWRGENLSYVQYGSFTFTPSEQSSAASLMFANLKASPTHYKNMVFNNFTKIGIATTATNTASGIKLTTAYMFTN